jgi:hypothetical protein
MKPPRIETDSIARWRYLDAHAQRVHGKKARPHAKEVGSLAAFHNTRAAEPRWKTTWDISIRRTNRFQPKLTAELARPSRERDYNTGTLELTQVTTNLGGTISGKFKINTTAFEEEKKP